MAKDASRVLETVIWHFIALLYNVFWHKAMLLLLPIGSFFCLKL